MTSSAELCLPPYHLILTVPSRTAPDRAATLQFAASHPDDFQPFLEQNESKESRVLEFSLAQPKDIPGIQSMVGSIFAEYGLEVDPEFDAPGLAGADHLAAASGGAFWVLREDGDIRGTCAYFRKPDHLELKTLYVCPSLRRLGWGKRFTKAVISEAKKSALGRVDLWSDTRFEKAHKLYESMGFVRHGTRDLPDINQSQEYGYRLEIEHLDHVGS